MSVYVDGMRAQFGSLVMCHMVADSHDELIAMVDIIKVQRKWIQKPGTIYEHFDVCLSKRALAVKYGAKQITMKELGYMFYARRQNAERKSA